MTDISGKLAYLRGLAEGANINDETPEGKISCAMIDLLTDVVIELKAMQYRAELLSGDMIDLESAIYEDFGEDDEVFEIVCDKCKAKTLFTEAAIFGGESVVCPECAEEIKIELPECDENCECCTEHSEEDEDK